jgi:hypothetical protein
MKQIILKIQLCFILLAGLLCVSCVKNLLEQEPTTELSQNAYWQTTDDALSALYGAYSDIRYVFNRDFYYDGLAEYIRGRGTTNGITAGNLNQGYAYQSNIYNNAASVGNLDLMYRYVYGGVNRANYVIDNVEAMLSNAKAADVGTLETIFGEARLLRGLCYFKLITMFGDVPLIEHIVTDKEEMVQLSRTPIAQIKDFIQADFTAAYEKLPDKASAVGRASKPAALAFRGKLQLYWACWNRFGWPELDGFTPSESEANAAYAAAAADFAQVIDNFGISLYKNGEPGECDELGKNNILPNYYELFTPESNGNEENLFVFTHGGPGTGQGEEYMRVFGASPHQASQAWLQPWIAVANRYQSTITGEFCDPLIPLRPDLTTDDVPNREVVNSAVNPQSYTNRDYRMKASILWDYELTDGMLSLQPAGKFPFIYGTYNTSVTIGDVFYPAVWSNDLPETGYAFRKFVRRTAGAGRNEGNYNWPVIRLADVYLMYAEADNAINGPQAKAIELVNKIRHRGNLPPLKADKTANKEVFFDAIEQERIIELLGEGTRWFDLRRWRALERVWGGVGGDGVRQLDSWGVQRRHVFQNAPQLTYERLYIVRIPPEERDKNPNLTQNKPWL